MPGECSGIASKHEPGGVVDEEGEEGAVRGRNGSAQAGLRGAFGLPGRKERRLLEEVGVQSHDTQAGSEAGRKRM